MFHLIIVKYKNTYHKALLKRTTFLEKEGTILPLVFSCSLKYNGQVDWIKEDKINRFPESGRSVAELECDDANENYGCRG